MSNVKGKTLSSEQALTDYFSALLDEELEFSDEAELAKQAEFIGDAEPTTSVVSEPELQAQPELSLPQVDIEYDEEPASHLDDVQKLLNNLESTHWNAEPEITPVVEEHTAQARQEIAEPEEIQEWVIETAVETVVEVNETSPQEAELQEPEIEIEPDLPPQTAASAFDEWTSTKRDVDFQVLYFDVNGITFAVPLDELGGIHRIGEMSHLIGRPSWYLGLQTNKENQYDVVDTAKWVMANRLQDDSHKEAYEYIVMLGESHWGLAATELKGTELLNAESVRWREQAGKRPWLAGMVKEKMCALIHVEAMITMIAAGLDVKSLGS